MMFMKSNRGLLGGRLAGRRRVWVRIALVVFAVIVMAVNLYWGFVRPEQHDEVPGMRVSSDFSAAPDGPVPATFGSGQPATNSNGLVAPGDGMKVFDRTLTFTPTSTGRVAGYFSTPDLLSPVRDLGASWVFRPGQGDTYGAVALLISRELQNKIPQAAPPFGMHLVITPINWNVSVKSPDLGEPLEVIASGSFAKPLPVDGKTASTVSVRVDGGKLAIVLPDGNKTIVKDPRISRWRGNFATFEVFVNYGATDAYPGFTKLWAESGS